MENESERGWLFAGPHRGNRLKQRDITFTLRSDRSPERNLVQLCVEQDPSPPVRVILQAIATPRMNLTGSGTAHRMTPEKC